MSRRYQSDVAALTSGLTGAAAPDVGRRTMCDLIQRKSAGGDAPAPEAAVGAPTEGGIQLPEGLRARLEGAAGADLSGVRLHTGAASAASAAGLDARAFAVGQDVHFGAGEYTPGTDAGDHLIAHEVAHTVQQAGGAARAPRTKLAVSQPGDALETAADAFADAFMSGASAPTLGAGTTQLSRAPNGGAATPTPKPIDGVMFDPPGNLDVPLGEVAGWSSIACGPKRGGALVRERMPDGTKYEWTLESKGMSLAPEQASSTTPRGALSMRSFMPGTQSATLKVSVTLPDGQSFSDSHSVLVSTKVPNVNWSTEQGTAAHAHGIGDQAEAHTVIARIDGNADLDTLQLAANYERLGDPDGVRVEDAGGMREGHGLKWTVYPLRPGPQRLRFKVYAQDKSFASEVVEVRGKATKEQMATFVDEASTEIRLTVASMEQWALQSNSPYRDALKNFNKVMEDEKWLTEFAVKVLTGFAFNAVGGILSEMIENVDKKAWIDACKGIVGNMPSTFGEEIGNKFVPDSGGGEPGSAEQRLEEVAAMIKSCEISAIELEKGWRRILSRAAGDAKYQLPPLDFDPLVLVRAQLKELQKITPDKAIKSSDTFERALWKEWLTKNDAWWLADHYIRARLFELGIDPGTEKDIK